MGLIARKTLVVSSLCSRAPRGRPEGARLFTSDEKRAALRSRHPPLGRTRFSSAPSLRFLLAEDKLKADAKREAETRERQQRELQALREQAEREAKSRADAEARARVAAERAAVQAENAARAKAEADWIRRIQAKVKGNVILPPDLQGNPEAIFEVVQLPTGEILEVQLRKSSGVRSYDEAVQRAILKSSPLPRPDRPDLFQRTLQLRFRPVD